MAPPDSDGHEQINFDNVANLTIKDGQLYWKKEKLKTETRQKLDLTFWQKVGAVVLSASVAVAAILTPVGQYVADLDKICPNTSYSAPYCDTWKKHHDEQEQELKAKIRAAEKPATPIPDTVPEPPPAPPLPVKAPAPPAADSKNTPPVNK
jgi:hypothetical protein